MAEWGAIVPSLQADWLEALQQAQQLNEVGRGADESG